MALDGAAQAFWGRAAHACAIQSSGIARLYDAHTLADGTPWFVMEYVDGAPLGEYCARHRCSILERLAFFRAVCETDPLFARLRQRPEFAAVRSAAIACKNEFLARRGYAGLIPRRERRTR